MLRFIRIRSANPLLWTLMWCFTAAAWLLAFVLHLVIPATILDAAATGIALMLLILPSARDKMHGAGKLALQLTLVLIAAIALYQHGQLVSAVTTMIDRVVR